MTPRKVLVKMVVRRLERACDSWPEEGEGFKHNPHFEWLIMLCNVFQDSSGGIRGSWLTDEEHAALKAFLGCLPTNEDMERFGSFRRRAFTPDVLREGYDLWVASTVMNE